MYLFGRNGPEGNEHLSGQGVGYKATPQRARHPGAESRVAPEDGMNMGQRQSRQTVSTESTAVCKSGLCWDGCFCHDGKGGLGHWAKLTWKLGCSDARLSQKRQVASSIPS